MSSHQPDDLDAVRLISETLRPFQPDEQIRILRWATEKLGIAAFPSASIASEKQSAPSTAIIADTKPTKSAAGSIDIKSFISEKQPPSDNQFAAAVAYYYRFVAPPEQMKDAISSEDLINACRLAGRARIGRPGQTLVNAHHAGLLEKAERGNYVINTVGENLVAMALPASSGAISTVKKKAKPPVKPKAVKKSGRGK